MNTEELIQQVVGGADPDEVVEIVIKRQSREKKRRREHPKDRKRSMAIKRALRGKKSKIKRAAKKRARSAQGRRLSKALGRFNSRMSAFRRK